MWFNCFIPASKTWNPAAQGTMVFCVCVTVGCAECCLMFQMRQMELNIKWVFIAESTESSHWSENSKCCDETPRGAQLQRLRAFIPKVTRGERAGGTHSCRHLTKRDKKANLNNTRRATLTKIKEEETQQNGGPWLMWHKWTKKDKHRQKLKLTWTHKGGWDTQQTENTPCYETWKYTETGNIKLKINDPQRKSHRLHGPWIGLSPRVTMDCISRRMWPSPLSAHEHFC